MLNITQEMRQEYKMEIVRWAQFNETELTHMMDSFYNICKTYGRDLNDKDVYTGLIIMMMLAYESSMSAMNGKFPENDIEEIHVGILRSIESGVFMLDFMDFLEVFSEEGYNFLFNEIDKTDTNEKE